MKERQNGGLYVEAGALTNTGLEESVIAYSKEEIQFRKTDPKAVLSRFKKEFSKAGVTAFNEKTGAESILKNHRYTERAKDLYNSGIRIVPFGGGKTVFVKLK